MTLQTPVDQLAEGQAVGFDSPPETGFVMTNGGGDNYTGKIGFKGFVVRVDNQLVVLSATCSHLGCAINLQAEVRQFACPCHGSRFALDGTVVHGPAIAPLSNYAWTQGSGPDQIIVAGVSLPGVG